MNPDELEKSSFKDFDPEDFMTKLKIFAEMNDLKRRLHCMQHDDIDKIQQFLLDVSYMIDTVQRFETSQFDMLKLRTDICQIYSSYSDEKKLYFELNIPDIIEKIIFW